LSIFSAALPALNFREMQQLHAFAIVTFRTELDLQIDGELDSPRDATTIRVRQSKSVPRIVLIKSGRGLGPMTPQQPAQDESHENRVLRVRC
jgi:hypothetical protein